MKCKKCRREIADNSVFCNWCGHKQITASDDVRVPTPKKKGNLWVTQVMINGERKFVSAPTEKECIAKAKAVKTEQIEIKKSAPNLKLGAVIDHYLKDHTNVISPSTYNQYKSYRRTRFPDYMDSSVRSINWQAMINKESEKKAPKTVKNAWSLVTLSLEYAGVQKPKVKLPKKRKSERKWLDYQQIQTFTKALYGKPYELGALLALQGLRRSEILYLSAEDCDLEKGLIHVRGAAVMGDGNKLVRKEYNKTDASTRTVHIVIPRLIELFRGKEGIIITTNPTTLYGSINKLCKRVDLPEVGVHGLRHSFCSLAHHLGWDEMTVMREGGWDDPTVVHQIYTHLSAQDANADVTKMIQFYSQ